MLMSIICWIVLGLLAGLVGNKVVSGRREGLPFELGLGLIGAGTAGWIFRSVGSDGVTGLNAWNLFVALSGASVLLMAWHVIVEWNVVAVDLDQMS